MNKDIKDALEHMLIRLRAIRDEIDAIGSQYKLSDIEVDALEQVQKDLGNSIGELSRLTI